MGCNRMVEILTWMAQHSLILSYFEGKAWLVFTTWMGTSMDCYAEVGHGIPTSVCLFVMSYL